MTLMRRPSSFADPAFRDAMERLFDVRLFRPIWPWNGEHGAVPALDLYSTAEAVVAEIALPGVNPEQLDITINDDVVTVSGSFADEQETTEKGYVHRELSRGAFSRSFTAPAAIKADNATASFKDGVLTLTLPKTEETKPKRVTVQVT